MAIFIFPRSELPKFIKSKLPVVLLSFIVVCPLPAFAAGYVISSNDRARATELSQQAYVTYQSGDYAQALALLGQADRLRPDQPDGWNLRGAILLKQKDYDQAQAAFARAVALDPDLWAAQFNLAEAFFQRKDYAHARVRFENLLSHTDRYKQANKWELVQYKTFVASLLMGDDQAAQKKLAKLPASGSATPAFLYAQAALSFSRKSPAPAQKSLAAAQAAFPVAINDLFSDSLAQAGWQTPSSLPMPPSAALASNVPASPSGPGGRATAAYVVDPQLQADSAGPLPVADAPMRPVVMPTIPASSNAPALPTDTKPKGRPTPSTVAVQVPPSPQLKTGSDLENGGLLLDSGL